MSMLLRLVLLCAMGLPASAVEQHVVVIVRREAPAPASSATPAPATSTPPAAAPRAPKDITAVWDQWWHHPAQIWVDSPSGPKPLLGHDNIYDDEGNIIPRVPDPYTYNVLRNPGDPEALREYLDWMLVFTRRSRLAMNSVPDAAYQMGIVGPQHLQVGEPRHPWAQDVGDKSGIAPQARGTPLVSAGEARELGMAPSEIPKLPGKASPDGFEVYWFWSPDCPVSVRMAADWFRFAQAVDAAGSKAVSIALHPDGARVAATLKIWAVVHGRAVESIWNTQDWTDLHLSLEVERTPTVLVINNQTAQVHRLVGLHREEELRTAYLAARGWEAWPARDPQEAAAAAPSSEPSGRESSPVLPSREPVHERPSRAVR